MNLLTPRRRFLITAPLALLLPAGLLTYLGLKMVELVDKRYEDRSDEIVNRMVTSVRNRARERIQTNFLAPFQDIIEPVRLSFERAPQEFRLPQELTFVQKIFFFDARNELRFYERQPAPEADTQGVAWHETGAVNEALINRLRSNFELELSDRDNQYLVTPILNDFRAIAHPEMYYVQNEQRELALYTLAEPDGVGNSQVEAYGFTVRFDYLNRSFFDELLNQMWQYQEMLPYPITIFDRSTALTVAMPESFTEETFQPSAKYRPRPFDGDIFPWYVVYFSQQTGLDFERNATNEKIVYYFLIAAANICMIAAVIGALRDIARELHLSDMRTNFVARVSHELRTPLGLIHLFAETLELGRVANEEKRQEYLHAITKESERLSHLINNILNFSQIEADRKLYSMSPQLVDEIVAEAAETLQYHLQRHEMQMDLQIEEDLPPVSCDRDAIGQVLYNLISNAVKYSPEGGTITLRAFQDAGWVAIQVADEGIGISNEYREKIFQQFFRLEKDPMVQKTGGSGLGLTVVKHIVQAHHGQISVDSQPGKGSTFTVKLPAMQSAKAKTRGSAPDIS